MVEAIFLLREGLFAPRMIYNWQGSNKILGDAPRTGHNSRNITQRATAEHKTDWWGQTEYPNTFGTRNKIQKILTFEVHIKRWFRCGLLNN